MMNIEQWLALLAQRFESNSELAQRLFHGRGDCYPGWEWINVDQFGQTLVAYVYQPWPYDAPLAALLAQISDQWVIQDRSQRPPVIQQSEGLVVHCQAQEFGLRYDINLNRQNPGLFLDMAPLRQWLLRHSKHRKVLNLFSFSCALSVAALKGGADQVINVDMAKGALTLGQSNHRLNQLTGASFWKHDILASFGKIGRHGPYDCIVVDPPVFQKGSIDLRRDYRKILNRVDGWLAPEGDLILTLNDPNLSLHWLLEHQALDGFEMVQRFELAKHFEDANMDRALRVLRFRRR